MNYMFGNSISMSQKSLEFLWAKQVVISQNLTNVDTPGYKAKYVTFEDVYQNRLKLARAAKTPAQTRSIIENSYYSINEKDSSARLDENNVNADAEEVELFLNGRSLGKKPAGEQHEFTATYEISYEPGELTAVSYEEGRDT